MPELTAWQQTRRTSHTLGPKRRARSRSYVLRDAALAQMGRRISERMVELDLSKNRLAVGLGVPVPTLHNWMRGRTMPSSQYIKALARHLRIRESCLVVGGC